MADIAPVFGSWAGAPAFRELARGARYSSEIDLSADFGAELYLFCGRTTSTALTNGVDVFVIPKVDLGSSVYVPALLLQTTMISKTASLGGSVIATNDSNAGDTDIDVTSGTNFAKDEWIYIGDSPGSDTACSRAEFNRVQKIATNAINLMYPLAYTHTTAQADKVAEADQPLRIYLPGGCKYDVIFDYVDDAAGANVIIGAYYYKYDKDTSA